MEENKASAREGAALLKKATERAEESGEGLGAEGAAKTKAQEQECA